MHKNENAAAHENNPSQGLTQPTHGFDGLGIAPKILAVLDRIHFKVPTPIQVKAIPAAVQGKDVIGIAQTGTGKTHSFAIPMVQLLAQKKGMGLVLAPTRELALQINDTFKALADAFGMKTACLIGGAPMQPQTQALHRQPRIVVATPGRLIDHMSQWNIMLDGVVMLVLDEADRMLDMGFAPQIDQILRFVPKERQTMLFSATIPPDIMKIASKQMKLPVCVEIARSGTVAEMVTQELFIVKREAKLKLLGKLLAQYQGAVLLFARTKHGASKITRSIREMGFRAAEMHSDRSLSQRRDALDGFKAGRYKVLVATDIAARGIDVTGIELVINYDLPDDASNYVHRIGRTGRAGHKGHAIALATPDQAELVRDIEKVMMTPLPISKHPEFPPEIFSGHPEPRRQPQQRCNRPQRSHGGQHGQQGGYGRSSGGSGGGGGGGGRRFRRF